MTCPQISPAPLDGLLPQNALLQNASLENVLQDALFQPVVDTFDHQVAAYQCLLRSEGDHGVAEAARIRALAIEAAARHSWQGLYFFHLTSASLIDLERDMSSTVEAVFDFGLKPGKIAFEVAEAEVIRDPDHTHAVRDYLRSNGFGVAMAHVGTSTGAQSFDAVENFKPDYINLDRRLIRNFDKPACAPMIGKLMRTAEKSGARVIADGVDRARTVENLWLLGVQFMQGNVFRKASSRAA